MSKVLIFKINRSISEENRKELQKDILKEFEDGVIVLPYYFLDSVIIIDRTENVEDIAIRYENFNGGCK